MSTKRFGHDVWTCGKCPYSTQEELIEAIYNRRQFVKEFSFQYIFAMLDLFSYLEPAWSDEKQTAYTLRNMLKRYRREFLKRNVKTMTDIMKKVSEVDQWLHTTTLDNDILLKAGYRPVECDYSDESIDYELTNKFEIQSDQSADKTDELVTDQLSALTVESADKSVEKENISVKVENQAEPNEKPF